MSMNGELHSQIASIMEVLANSAVAEICKAVEDGYAVMNLEVSRGQKENECLRRRVRLLELQVSRYRAEQRLKPPVEGAASGRVFPGVRLFRSGRDTPTGFSLHGRTRVANRSFVSQPQQKTPPLNLDQDPDQEVVTTTKTEPIEPEEDSDLVIVKVEGSVSVEEPGVSNNNNNNLRTSTSDPRACSQTEDQEVQEKPRSFWKSEVEEDEGDFKTSPSEEPSPFITNWSDPNLGQSSDSVQELTALQTRVDLNPTQVCASSVQSSDPRFRPEHFTTDTAEALALNRSQQFPPVFPGPSRPPSYQLQNSPFSCVICHRVFAQKTELRSHRTVHQEEKPYKCDFCGKTFDSLAHMKRHKQVHTGERPHPCPQCGKQFSTANNLKVHQSVHTGERRFKCNTCGKTYTFHSNLIRHQAVHVRL